jgi:hypothetical protein
VNWTRITVNQRYRVLQPWLVVGIVVLGAASCSSGRRTVAGPGSTVPVITFDDAERMEIQDPDWLAADEHFVYLKLDSHQVLRLDPVTGRTLGVTEVGGGLCQGIGASYGAV